jgi:hypothetical protein
MGWVGCGADKKKIVVVAIGPDGKIVVDERT